MAGGKRPPDAAGVRTIFETAAAWLGRENPVGNVRVYRFRWLASPVSLSLDQCRQ
jgi:hypothetical protein